MKIRAQYTMLGAHIKSHIARSMSLTSMKGIPRALKIEKKILKCIWIIGILGLFAICVKSV